MDTWNLLVRTSSRKNHHRSMTASGYLCLNGARGAALATTRKEGTVMGNGTFSCMLHVSSDKC